MTQTPLAAHVSVFSGSTNVTPVESVPLTTVLERIQDGTYRGYVEQLRHILAGRDEKAYRAAKEQSMGFTPCCALRTRAQKTPWADKLISVTGLVHFDSDDVEGPEDLKHRMAQDPCLVFAFVSPSGRGLKTGFAASGITGPDDYKHAWHALLDHFKTTYSDVRFSEDLHVKYLNALCYVSYDPLLYVNANAIPFIIPPPAPKRAPKSRPWAETPDYTRVASALAYIPNNDTDYDTWLTLGMSLHSTGEAWARDLWDGWSRQSSKFDEAKQQKSWESFTADGKVQIGTLFQRAKEAGWRPPRDTLRVNGTQPHARVVPDMTGHDSLPPGAPPVVAEAPGRERFRVDEHGVWYTPPLDTEGNQPPDLWVCAPLHIVAATRDVDSNNHGHLLEFHDRHGHSQQWAMPLELLEERREYRKVLRRLGLPMNGAAAKLLQQYLEVCDAKERARCVDRVGWYGAAYVLPEATLGDPGEERLVLQTLDRKSEGYRQAGTLDGWRTAIAARCVGNSRLLLAVSAGFAAPLLSLLNEESGGLHLRGESSAGKTTALLVAATVWGEPGRLERWRSTANALEGVALAHNDNLLCLDELKELDPREAGSVAYMLANGTGKRRGQPHGGTRPRLTWRLLFLSTGETSLEQHIAEAGQRSHAGQEVRLVDMPADAGAGLGVFEALHDAPDSKTFADQLREATSCHYGHAGRAFVAALSQDCVENVTTVQQLRNAFVHQHVPAAASGQVYRVATRFGLIGAAGELATAAGLTDWPKDAALAAAARCFIEWLQARGGVGNAEEVRALSQVRLFFERFQEARFKPWTLSDGGTCERCHGSGRVEYSYRQGVCFDCHGRGTITSETEPNRPIYDRAGFRRATMDGRTEFYVLPEVFQHEIARGFEVRWLTKVLIAHGLLLPDHAGKSQQIIRLPSIGQKRCYRFAADVLGAGECEEAPTSGVPGVPSVPVTVTPSSDAGMRSFEPGTPPPDTGCTTCTRRDADTPAPGTDTRGTPACQTRCTTDSASIGGPGTPGTPGTPHTREDTTAGVSLGDWVWLLSEDGVQQNAMPYRILAIAPDPHALDPATSPLYAHLDTPETASWWPLAQCERADPPVALNGTQASDADDYDEGVI